MQLAIYTKPTLLIMKIDYSHFTPSTYMLCILRNIIAAFNTCAALVDKYHSIATRKTLAFVAEKF